MKAKLSIQENEGNRKIPQVIELKKVKKIPQVRHPSGLIADSGDNKAYLEWNENLEESIVCYTIYRKSENAFNSVGKIDFPNTSYVDAGIKNGTMYDYYITAKDISGYESTPSNIISVIPGIRNKPSIEEGERIIRIPNTETVYLENAVEVTFSNGNRIIFDKKCMKVRDWRSSDGTHLMYSGIYGDPIALTEMDNYGHQRSNEASMDSPCTPPLINANYSNFNSPYVNAIYKGFTVEDARVTFNYAVPFNRNMEHGFFDIYETWYECNKHIGDAEYKGLYRRIEIDVPEAINKGYSVCINDGFFANGRTDDFISYDMTWGVGLEEISYRGANEPRGTRNTGFHPSGSCLQVSPFIFFDFNKGSMLISQRRFYNFTGFHLRKYSSMRRPGIWPNFAVDCAESGRRYCVDTFEYLYTSDKNTKSPQKYIDSQFHYRDKLAILYGLDKKLTSANYGWHIMGYPDEMSDEQLIHEGKELADFCAERNIDLVGGAHTFWFSSPYAADEEVLTNPNHPATVSAARYIKEFLDKGIRFSYWLRAEFVKAPTAVIMQESIKNTKYYGLLTQKWPNAVKYIQENGYKLVRDNLEWLICGKDGTLPNNTQSTPYNWSPVSLASGWYDKVIVPTLEILWQIGVTGTFLDGGHSGYAGVDYRPEGTKAVQHYWWRYFMDMAYMGFEQNGEVNTGWGNSATCMVFDADGGHRNLWGLSHMQNRGPYMTARHRHLSHSLYGGVYSEKNITKLQAEVSKFYLSFLKENGAPDRIHLINLRWDYIDGKGIRPEMGWIWDNAEWVYNDGRRILYPNFKELFGDANDRDEFITDIDKPRGMIRSR